MIKLPLNQSWQFSDGNQTVEVDLPHDFIITKPRRPDAPGGAPNGYFGEGVGTYRKTLDLPDEWLGKRVMLDIDGASMNAEVWLNGELLQLHPYGYTPFLVDLTSHLKPKGNKLKIVTQSLQPSTRWYSGGGLYRGVSLWIGGGVHVAPWDVFVITPVVEKEKALVNANITVTNTLDGDVQARIRCVILDAGGTAVVSGEALLAVQDRASVDIQIPIANPCLWDIGTPCLYSLKTLVEVNGVQVDQCETRFGIRKIEISPERGFQLNGRTVKLKGGCIHHDNGLLGACAYPRAEQRKIEILMDAGYNAVRISHNPPSLAMLEACDRLGMLLLDEAFDTWRIGMAPLDYHLYFEGWWARDIGSMVMRDRNHPCVISYSIGNEIPERDGRSDGALWSRRLADKVRELDDTRFVLSALHNLWPDPDNEDDATNFDANMLKSEGEVDIWGERTRAFVEPLDIVGYNYLQVRYAKDRIRFPSRVICGTESNAFDTYDYWQATLANTHVIGDFIWVAFDNLGEAGVGRTVWGTDERPGFFGEYPWRTCFQGDHDICGHRLPQSYYREILWEHTDKPALFTTHPSHYGQPFSGTGWHWYDVQDSWTFGDEYLGKPVSVQVYGDGDEAEFILNGQSLGRQMIERLIASMDIPYQPGTLEAVVYASGAERGRVSLSAVGIPVTARVRADRTEIAADGLDLCYIAIEIVDEAGRRVPHDQSRLSCAVSQPGILAGLGNGDPKSEDLFGDWQCRAYEGRALAIVKAGAPGCISITVSVEGMWAQTLEITAR